MRIAISTPAYPLPGDPTRGRYIYEIARTLGKLATVEVFFHTGRYPRYKWLQPRSYVLTDVTTDLSTPDVRVCAFDYPSLPVVSRLVNGWVSGRSLLPHLRRFKPDVVLAYWLYPEGFGAWRCARQLGVPCVMGGLGTDVRARDSITRWLTGMALRSAEQSIMVSEEMRGLAITQFGVPSEKVHTIANGVNTDVFHPRDRSQMRQKLGLPENIRLIVFVGRFVAAKGVRELITACTALFAQDATVRLALIGDGVMRDELQARIAESAWGGRVLMPGALQPDGVAEWLGAADLLCLPSYSEGNPNVVVEAIASGRPVVSTNVGGTPELINAANGLLVPARDADALQRALASCLAAQWSPAAISASMQRSWDHVAQATFAICQQAVKAKHAR